MFITDSVVLALGEISRRDKEVLSVDCRRYILALRAGLSKCTYEVKDSLEKSTKNEFPCTIMSSSSYA
jgi:hypothetical protein